MNFKKEVGELAQAMEKKQEKNLENSLKELESIVKKLESGELGLEESIKVFEEGIKSFQKCKETIYSAEKKIKVLTESLEELDYKD